MNFTDPESRIMPVSGSKDFEQCYNAQAAVEVESRLIIAAEVVQATNDKELLVPGVAAVSPVISSIANVLADSGYHSEAAVQQVEQTAEGKATGTTVYAATKRSHHQRSVRDLEKHDTRPHHNPEPVPASAWPTAPAQQPDERCTNCDSKPSNPSSALSKARWGFAASA